MKSANGVCEDRMVNAVYRLYMTAPREPRRQSLSVLHAELMPRMVDDTQVMIRMGPFRYTHDAD